MHCKRVPLIKFNDKKTTNSIYTLDFKLSLFQSGSDGGRNSPPRKKDMLNVEKKNTKTNSNETEIQLQENVVNEWIR